ncbi:MerR family transcriptional regulator [Sporosarcina sp. 179-K 3D1 HS]|uniref:MerR family transcriptional regulator n=1 Tax=Sporosarcina sp. 179-K 3D1 HS TaxID=3232169 RepID=UPI0039A07979
MKIGGFAKQFNVTVDTVRYYIELGLLIPDRENKQYRMNQNCLEDMALINMLKGFRFSLKEIHAILSLRRLTNSPHTGDSSYFTDLLVQKKEELRKEKQQIATVIRSIESKIESTPSLLSNDPPSGVPLYFVPYFSCPHCQQQLNLNGVTMQGSFIYEGVLQCGCSYEARIEEGILVTDQLRSSPSNYSIYNIDVTKWNPEFISLLEKGKLWMLNELKRHELDNKVLIETNIEVSMLLPKYLATLSPTCHYIFTGHSFEDMKILKQKIELLDLGLNVLYMVNSDLCLPLAHGSIDFFIDSVSFTQFSLLYREPPVSILQPFLKQSGRVIGSFLYYEPSMKSLKNIHTIYSQPNQEAFKASYLESNFEENGMTLLNKVETGYTDNPGSYFVYHDPEEKLKLLTYQAGFVVDEEISIPERMVGAR